MSKLIPTLTFESFGNLEKWKGQQALLEAAKSQSAPDLDEVKDDIERSIATIVGMYPFFGAFIYRFRILYVEWNHPHIQTMATDGKNIFINPAFAASLTDAQTTFVLCHEILHNVMVHFLRATAKGVDDHERWNVAADYEINPMLVDEGLLTAAQVKDELHGLYDEKYLDLPAEEIYDRTPSKKMPPLPQWLLDKIKKEIEKQNKQNKGQQQQGQGQSQPGQGQPQPGQGQPGSGSGEGQGQGQPGQGQPGQGSGSGSGNGEVFKGEGIGGILTKEQSVQIQKELGVPVEVATEKDGNKLIEEAYQNKQHIKSSTSRGTGKGLLQRAIERMAKPQVNWKNELRRIIGKMTARSEEYFGKKKHLYRGDYLYGDKESEGALKTAVMTVDTSGSMGDDELKAILTEIYDIIKSKKIKKTEIVYFDDGIQGIDIVKNPPHFDWSKAKGGGGTSFIQPIEHIAKRNKQGKLELAVFCTDGYGDQNKLDKNPKFAKKFIWLIIDNPGWEAPFGRVIHINTKN